MRREGLLDWTGLDWTGLDWTLYAWDFTTDIRHPTFATLCYLSQNKARTLASSFIFIFVFIFGSVA